MTKDELNRIISDHGLWLADKSKGKWANLAGVNLSKANLSRANLTEADLTEADLTRADLTGANLSGANLSGANLSGANLSGANLSGADLTRVIFTDANLARVDLIRANLTGANLSGANLSRANLFGANLYYTQGQILSIGPIGSRQYITIAYGYNGQIYVNCGCFNGTLDEFGARVAQVHKETPDGRAYASACNHIRTQAKEYDWFKK